MKSIKKLAALVLAGVLTLSIFTGCGVDASKTAATLGEQKVSLGLVNFMTKYQKASLDDMYVAYFGKDVWDMDMSGNGVSLQETLISNIMSELHDLYTIKANMSEYKVTLTADEEAAIKKAAQTFMSSNSEDAIKELGATEEYVTEMLTLYTIQNKVYEEIIKETDRNVSDEEANMRGYSIITMPIDGEYDKNNSFVEFTEAQIKEIKANAEKMVKEMAESKMEDVAKKYKYDVEEAAYSTKTDDETLEDVLLKGLKELKEGEVSKVITGEDDLYIVRIDADTDKEATEENRESIIEEREAKLYDDVMTKWQKEDGWKIDKNALKQIDFHHILTLDDGSTEKDTSKDTEKSTETEKTTETESATEDK